MLERTNRESYGDADDDQREHRQDQVRAQVAERGERLRPEVRPVLGRAERWAPSRAFHMPPAGKHVQRSPAKIVISMMPSQNVGNEKPT